MRLHDELRHYGVLGMRWGVRKDAYRRLERAQKDADKKQLKIEEHDARLQLKKTESTLDRNDKEAVKRYKLQKKALKARIKARRLEIELRKPFVKTFESGPDLDARNENRSQFERKYQNPQFAQRVNNKPMGDFKRDSVFKRALTEAAVKGAGTATSVAVSKFVEPSATQYGTQFVKYLTTEQTRRGLGTYVTDTWTKK